MHGQGYVVRVAGPLVTAKGLEKPMMYEVVRVGELKLFGEIIGIEKDLVYIQVYEDTNGLRPGETVEPTGQLLSVELGPGLTNNIFDGIQRPLERLREESGEFLARGFSVNALDRQRKWHFVPLAEAGVEVEGGSFLGEVIESSTVVHKIMVPPNVKGTLQWIAGEGEYTVEECIAKVELPNGTLQELQLMQRWPVRIPRPVKEKVFTDVPMLTGQRILDVFFPVIKGGTACVPGPFGSGKTVIQHQLAKWSDVDVVVYVGCGERGNEMTEVLIEFPELKDPRTGGPLMDRTILVANTSNMPVAAREASVFTGIAIAEYYRDMGYDVALMADSTSRWAEAMREISTRLEEMPGEEGYPAYLASRISAFYERSGFVKCLGSPERTGSVTVIGAVSPPGGDLSDPVVQATLRSVQVFWGLDQDLAFARHFPAINWLNSYSLYLDRIGEYYNKSFAPDWLKKRNEAMVILQRESELLELVRLVGYDALSTEEQLFLETARSLREDFLQQDAFDDVDSYCSLRKQYVILSSILLVHEIILDRIRKGEDYGSLIANPIREHISQLRWLKEEEVPDWKQMQDSILKSFSEEVKAHD
ncbi:ATP synthase subunit A [Coprothermobacter proteolyticus DSM 5265]|uniref:V-type ATP synthase alpha chain n=1 Tax=Coprothermobacter proteolyticus (strain ATCC 35245 / DSM 5265 / OCM 4 / BT) TaxID=309798 RepID=B5Y8B5_COPPD|nr:V-type ATP synthase subunit A [Coprothermobacter proteolyticus]ACI17254.1 ATP synthase subunit A [Coprothermobacter proteolyticus DSM 5265]